MAIACRAVAAAAGADCVALGRAGALAAGVRRAGAGADAGVGLPPHAISVTHAAIASRLAFTNDNTIILIDITDASPGARPWKTGREP